MSDDTSIKRGSKNLFADLGYADPETHLLKAGLVRRIQDIIGDSKLTHDISTTLCAKLEVKFAAHRSKEINIICGDFFALQGSYDLVIEQTFFCALDPGLRTAYAEKIYSLLKPGGKLTGVLFNCAFQNNPPFGGSESEYRQLFQQKFTIAVLENCYNSIASRSGKELFIKLVKERTGAGN